MLWITSTDVTFNTTGRPTGMCSSLAVLNCSDGVPLSYSASHHHWCPVSLMVTALDAPSDATARLVHTLAIRSPSSVTTVAATATPTTTVIEPSLSASNGGRSRDAFGCDAPLRRPRANAST